MTILSYSLANTGAKNGKLEGRISVPSGGWAVAANDGGGADTATIPEGTYYLSSADSESNDLLAELEAQLESATGNSWTVSIAAGEAGSGRVTLACNVASSISWTSTELRNALGFTGGLSSATSHLSPQSARSLWLPDCPFVPLVPGEFEGVPEADLRAQVSWSGRVFAFAGQERTKLALRWDAVIAERAWTCLEATANQSFEKFWRDVIIGQAAWSLTPTGPVRFYRDADDDVAFSTYKIPTLNSLSNVEQFVAEMGAMYRVRIPELVLQDF